MGEVTERVERAIREIVDDPEKLGPGGRLPSERTLSTDLRAGRTTVRLVLMRLEAEGRIRSEHGRGYFVCDGAEQS